MQLKHQYDFIKVRQDTYSGDAAGNIFRIILRLSDPGFNFRFDPLSPEEVFLVSSSNFEGTILPIWQADQPLWVFDYNPVSRILKIDCILSAPFETRYEISEGLGQLRYGYAKPTGEPYNGSLSYTFESKYDFIPVYLVGIEYGALPAIGPLPTGLTTGVNPLTIEGYPFNRVFENGIMEFTNDFLSLCAMPDNLFAPRGRYRLTDGLLGPDSTEHYAFVFQRIR